MECKSAWRLNALESAFRFTTVQGSQVVSHRGISCCSPVVQCHKNHHNNHFWKIPKKNGGTFLLSWSFCPDLVKCLGAFGPNLSEFNAAVRSGIVKNRFVILISSYCFFRWKQNETAVKKALCLFRGSSFQGANSFGRNKIYKQILLNEICNPRKRTAGTWKRPLGKGRNIDPNHQLSVQAVLLPLQPLCSSSCCSLASSSALICAGSELFVIFSVQQEWFWKLNCHCLLLS